MLEALGNLLRARSGQPGSSPPGRRGRPRCRDAARHAAPPAAIPGHCRQAAGPTPCLDGQSQLGRVLLAAPGARGHEEGAWRRSGAQRAAMHTQPGAVPEDFHHGVPHTALSCQPHGPGGSTSCSTSAGRSLIPVQTGQGPATSTRAKTEPGGDRGASWDLPPAPAAGQDVEGGTLSHGAGSGATGSREPAQLPKAKSRRLAVGQGRRQWGRAGGRELLHHESPAPRAAGAWSPAALPRCLAGSGATAAGGRAARHRGQPRKQPPPARPCSQAAQPGSPSQAAPRRLQRPGDAGLPQLSEGQRARCWPRSGCTAIAGRSQKGRAQAHG